jgi:Lrp/AsnC family leucine-responsive transcriptional regulator
MALSFPNNDIDETDLRLIEHLTRNGRATWADLAHDLGLTAPAIAQRVRRLEDRGIIRQFTAVIDPERIAPVGVFVLARLRGGSVRDDFRTAVLALGAVQECHLLAGDDGYLLKARFRSFDELQRFVDVTLPALPGVEGTSTNIVLTTVKESPALPLPLPSAA